MVPLRDRSDGRERPRGNFIDDGVNTDARPNCLARIRRPATTRPMFAVSISILSAALPEPKEVDAFLADGKADKRERLVGELMKRPEFIDHWAYFWGDLLRIESRRLKPEGATAFHRWVREQVDKNTPYDKFARELILATGDGFKHGPANFSRVTGDRPFRKRNIEPGFPRRPAAMRQLPQPPARPLDAGRLPRAGRRIRESRPGRE